MFFAAHYTKSRLLLDFRRGAQRVSPVCCGLLLWFRWAGRENVDQSPHGRDGHAPPFSAAKSNFKGTMVLDKRSQAVNTGRVYIGAFFAGCVPSLESVIAKRWKTFASSFRLCVVSTGSDAFTSTWISGQRCISRTRDLCQ